MVPTKLVCVYCGASPGADPSHVAAAHALGGALVDGGYGLVYGGAHTGLMGAVSDAVLEAGGQVVGVIPDCLEERELARDDCTELIVTPSMHARKARMVELAEAIVVLPGGIGTLDEFFEALTWRDLGLHDKPIAVMDTAGYWAPLFALLESGVESGFVRPEALRGFRAFREPRAVVRAITSWQRDEIGPRWSQS